MNNVWTAIALRARCVARQSQCARQPILQLFNGYSRNNIPLLQQAISKQLEQPCRWRHQFSTSVVRQKTPKAKAKAKTSRASPGVKRKAAPRVAIPEETPSKLEPAATVASYTEGVLAEEEPLTWRDYDPLGGMPLADGERSQPQINGIFGGDELDAGTGNYILSVMYWRRQSGALIDVGLDFPSDSGVSREQALRGLEYVRSLDPAFDEQGAAQTWAEEESARLQDEITERAVKLRLYKPDYEPEPEQQPQVYEEPSQDTSSRTSDSALVHLREANKAKLAAEETARAATQERKEVAALATHRGPLQLSGGVQPPTITSLTPSGGITITRPQQKAWLQPVERKPWVKYYEQRAQIIKDNVVPQMSLFRRLVPPLIVLLAILGFCSYLSENYTPPPKPAKIWPDTPPSVATLTGLTAVLFTFFILGRIPPLWRTYSKYFTIVPAYPYSASLLGAIFRHDTPSHLLINTGALWFFGSLLHEDVGRGTFISIFLASGAIGGYASLVYNVVRANWTVYIFGSSGAALGVLSASCALRPNGSLKVAGYEIPVAAWIFLALYGLGEVVAVVKMRPGNIDHAGHVGGMVAGAACALWLRMKSNRSGREQDGSLMSRAGAETAIEAQKTPQ